MSDAGVLMKLPLRWMKQQELVYTEAKTKMEIKVLERNRGQKYPFSASSALDTDTAV